MASIRFGSVGNALEEVWSRRQALRLLTAGAAGVVVAQAGLQGSDAKKRKNRKNKKKVCKPGKLFQTVSVPATGGAATTQALINGQRYRLRASGFWNTNAQFGNDAFAAFPFANPNAPELTFNGVRLGLSVDGGSPDQWGSYNAGHVYEREIIGQGASLSLRFTDPQTADNSGSLTVEIFCA